MNFITYSTFGLHHPSVIYVICTCVQVEAIIFNTQNLVFVSYVFLLVINYTKVNGSFMYNDKKIYFMHYTRIILFDVSSNTIKGPNYFNMIVFDFKYSTRDLQ